MNETDRIAEETIALAYCPNGQPTLEKLRRPENKWMVDMLKQFRWQLTVGPGATYRKMTEEELQKSPWPPVSENPIK